MVEEPEESYQGDKKAKNLTYGSGRNPKLQIDIIRIIGRAIDLGVAFVCCIGDVPLFLVGAKRLHVHVDH
jgi:hypothetical protein